MPAIDVGQEAINRDATSPANYTWVQKANPANLAGTITSIDIWAATALSGCKVGLLYLIGGLTYKVRSVATIGNVPSGSKQTFPVDLAVEAGDVLAIFFSGGTVERGTGGGDGYWYLEGDHLTVDEESEFTNGDAASAYSEYGTGFGLGAPTVTSVRLTGNYKAITGVGNITDKGGYTVTKRGFAYNTTGAPDPEVDDVVEEEGDFELGEYSLAITNLDPSTLYYVVACAYSVEEGYGSGAVLQFTTQSSALVLATLSSRFMGAAANITYADMYGGGGGVDVIDPDATTPDHLCGVDDTMTASPWLLRTFLYFDLAGLEAVGCGIVELWFWLYARATHLENVRVTKGLQGEPLVLAHWTPQNAETTLLGSIVYNDATVGAWNKITLNLAGRAWVKSKLGTICKLCIRTQDDVNNDFNPVVHDSYFHFYLPHEVGKEPYLLFAERIHSKAVLIS